MSILDPNEQQTAEQATENGLLPEGEYTAHITAVEKWKSGTSLVWKFVVAPGQPGAGEDVWDWTAITPKGIWRTKARYAALGLTLDATEEQACAVPVTLTVEIGDYNGEPKNKVVGLVRYEGELAAAPVAAVKPDDSDIPF
jgi:hypothetical protein